MIGLVLRRKILGYKMVILKDNTRLWAGSYMVDYLSMSCKSGSSVASRSSLVQQRRVWNNLTSWEDTSSTVHCVLRASLRMVIVRWRSEVLSVTRDCERPYTQRLEHFSQLQHMKFSWNRSHRVSDAWGMQQASNNSTTMKVHSQLLKINNTSLGFIKPGSSSCPTELQNCQDFLFLWRIFLIAKINFRRILSVWSI